VFADRDRGRLLQSEHSLTHMSPTHPNRRRTGDPTTKQTGSKATEQIDERTDEQSATIEAHR